MTVNPNWAETISGTEAAKNPVFKSASEECQNYYNKIMDAEPAITDSIKSMAQNNGFAMHGLENSVKTVSSIEEKFLRTEEAYEKDGIPVPKDIDMLNEFKDILRYTIITDHRNIVPATKTILSDIKEYGFELFKVSNKFEKPEPESGYKGMHIGVISSNALKVEIQVHSEESQTAKDKGHPIYEEVRDVKSGLTKEEKAELLRECQEIYAEVETPPRISEIEDFNVDPDPIVERIEAAIEADAKEQDAVSNMTDKIIGEVSEIIKENIEDVKEDQQDENTFGKTAIEESSEDNVEQEENDVANDNSESDDIENSDFDGKVD